MANTKKSIKEILATTDQSLTPYEVFRLWQDEIDKNEIDRELKPQMAYNYDRNGLIVKGRASKNESSAGRYSVEEAMAFIAKWIMKNYKIDIAPQIEENTENTENTECEGQLELIEA